MIHGVSRFQEMIIPKPATAPIVKICIDEAALAPFLACAICHKRMVDPTAISDCHHTFCRLCVYERTAEPDSRCFTCGESLGTFPRSKLRPDRELQQLIFKFYPPPVTKSIAPALVAAQVPGTAFTAKVYKKRKSVDSLEIVKLPPLIKGKRSSLGTPIISTKNTTNSPTRASPRFRADSPLKKWRAASD